MAPRPGLEPLAPVAAVVAELERTATAAPVSTLRAQATVDVQS